MNQKDFWIRSRTNQNRTGDIEEMTDVFSNLNTSTKKTGVFYFTFPVFPYFFASVPIAQDVGGIFPKEASLKPEINKMVLHEKL